MVKYLLDTNICIYLMKEQPTSVKRHFETLQPGDLAISAITLAELDQGIGQVEPIASTRRLQLDSLLLYLPVITFDESSAKIYGSLRRRGESLKRNRFDTLIAAQALASGLVLVTNNPRDFSGIEDLVVENWVDSCN